MKPLHFLGTALADLRAFPDQPRSEAGHQLNTVQKGEIPDHWKPMTTVGPGAMEICVRVQGEWRILYVAKLPAAIYVLHAFEKKTQKTPQDAIELARKRYREIPQ